MDREALKILAEKAKISLPERSEVV